MRGFDPASEHENAIVRELWLGHRGRIRAYVFELAAGLGYMFVGISFLLDPQQAAAHSTIGRQIPPFDTIWSVMEVLGGVMMIAGVLKPLPRLRVAGLLILGTALTMRVTAGLLTAAQIGIAFHGVFALACFLRAALITRLFFRVRSP